MRQEGRNAMVKDENIIRRYRNRCGVITWVMRCEKCGKTFEKQPAGERTNPLCMDCTKEANREKVRSKKEAMLNEAYQRGYKKGREDMWREMTQPQD